MHVLRESLEKSEATAQNAYGAEFKVETTTAERDALVVPEPERRRTCYRSSNPDFAIAAADDDGLLHALLAAKMPAPQARELRELERQLTIDLTLLVCRSAPTCIRDEIDVHDAKFDDRTAWDIRERILLADIAMMVIRDDTGAELARLTLENRRRRAAPRLPRP